MVFVSYSWVNEAPDDFVLQLVATLRNEGVEAVLVKKTGAGFEKISW